MYISCMVTKVQACLVWDQMAMCKSQNVIIYLLFAIGTLHPVQGREDLCIKV